MTPANVISWIGGFVLVALLGWACVADLRSRRIPNAAVAAIAVTGIAAALLGRSPTIGLLQALEGMLVGLLLWLPFYAFGMLGAGDVKLFAAAAAWLGPQSALEGAFVAALVGGVLALAFVLAGEGAAMTVLRLRTAIRSPSTLREASVSQSTRVPYALAMSAGVLAAAYIPGFV